MPRGIQEGVGVQFSSVPDLEASYQSSERSPRSWSPPSSSSRPSAARRDAEGGSRDEPTASSSSRRRRRHHRQAGGEEGEEGEDEEEEEEEEESSDGEQSSSSDDDDQCPADAGDGAREEKEKSDDAETDITSSYYAVHDIRIPPQCTHQALRRFYAFFLLMAVPVRAVKKRKLGASLKAALPSSLERERELMRTSGACPVPLSHEPHAAAAAGKSWWLRIVSLEWILLAFSVVALSVHALLAISCAGPSNARLVRGLFALFDVLSWTASMLLASDILSRRFIGTRMHYLLRQRLRRQRTRKLLVRALEWPLVAMLACVTLGVVGDVLSWADMEPNLRRWFGLVPTGGHTSSFPPQSLSDWLLLSLWVLSSLVIRLQQFSGAAVVTALLSSYLLHVNTCTRSLKQPRTKVRRANSLVFDIDTSLADLSFTLDLRLSALLLTSFLTFFFQAVYVANFKQPHTDEPGNGHHTAARGTGGKNNPHYGVLDDVLVLLFHCSLCTVLLLGCSTINSACQRLRIVADRYVSFQERQRLNAVDIISAIKAKGGGGGGGGGGGEHGRDEQPNADADTEDEDEVTTKRERSRQRQQRQQSTQQRKTSERQKRSEEGGTPQKELHGQSSSASASALSPSDGGGGSGGSGGGGGGAGSSSASSSLRRALECLPASEAVERSTRDRDGDGDVDVEDDLALLQERITAMRRFLKNADIKLRLANIEVDPRVLWTFAVIAASTLFSLLQLNKPPMAT